MLPSDDARPPCKSAVIWDSFGHKGAVFFGVHHCTESLLSLIMPEDETDRQSRQSSFASYLLLVFTLGFETRVHAAARLQERTSLGTLRRVVRKSTRDVDTHKYPTVS